MQPAADQLVHVFVGEVALLFLVRFLPELQHLALDPAHGLFFRDAGVGDAVHAAFAQRHFFGVAQVAIVRHALVMIVRDKIENIFLEVRARRADGVNFALPDHFREREAQFGGAHRSRHRQEHFSAAREMRDVGFGGIHHDRRIEMPELVLDKIFYAHVRPFSPNYFLGEHTCANPMLHAPMFQAKNVNCQKYFSGREL